MSYDSIPDELKELRQWICWRYEDRQSRSGEWTRTKVPVNARSKSAKMAKTTDPTTWSAFETAVKRVSLQGDGIVPVDGIGFVFTKDDPYIGIDIDRDFDSDIDNALGIVEAFDSYAEWSPSGTGIHIIAKGAIPSDRSGRRVKGIEIYRHSRFFTMTGRVFDATTLHRNP